MIINCKKVPDCTSHHQTYEYCLSVDGEELLAKLPAGYSTRENEKLKNPVFFADDGNIQIKGVVNKPIVKISYLSSKTEELKASFETFLNSF